MKKLLNTLYLTTPDLYLSKDGEDFVIKKDNKLIKRYPHHIFSAITAFTNPRSQGCPRFQSGEELVNSVGKINACYLL